MPCSEVATAHDSLPQAGFGLVTALGVTSCIVDDQRFSNFLGAVSVACRPGGSLVLVDSLSRGPDALTQFRSGYVARYRAVDNYRTAVRAAGFGASRRARPRFTRPIPRHGMGARSGDEPTLLVQAFDLILYFSQLTGDNGSGGEPGVTKGDVCREFEVVGREDRRPPTTLQPASPRLRST